MKVKVERSVQKFLESLEIETRAKVTRTINLLEQFGNQIGMPQSKRIGRDLFELRARGRQEVRIFYTFRHGAAILLHAFIKKSQKTPRKELRKAMSILRDLS